MPLSHITKVFAAKDAKFWPITADVAGGTITYGTGIDVPGLKTVAISGEINSAELRGDSVSLDRQSSLGAVNVKMEWAKQSLDILAALFSNTVTDSGTTPAQISKWELLGTTKLGYVGMSCSALGADPVAGDTQFVVAKMVLTSFPEMGLAEEEYKTFTAEFGAMPTLANSKILSNSIFETAAALVAPA
jgi:hypothetical protein